MKLKNLPEKQMATLREKHANACEKWAKTPRLNPTVDTYTEAYFRGAKHALSLPVIPFSEAAKFLTELELQQDKAWRDRAWKAIMEGDAENSQDALKLTERADPPSDPSEENQTPSAAPQEPADPDQEDVA